MNGLINVYKEKGWTSHDVVAKLRGILKTKKIGHAGTLDPQAEGVLPIGLGKGARLLEYVGDSHKVYEAELVFGLVSDSEDLQGNLEEVPYEQKELTQEKIVAVFNHFDGKVIAQVPPMYSSVKVNGRKLYQYARAGIVVERESRNVNLFQVKPLSELYWSEGHWCLLFRAKVSKGTYIRTLCVELGKALGVPGVMGSLTRQEAGNFNLKDSLTLEVIKQRAEADDFSFIQPLRFGLEGLMLQAELTKKQFEKIRLGQKIPNEFPVDNGTVFAGIYLEELVCILRNDDGLIRIIKNVGE